ncbi:cation-transporting P-type ATPase [Metapseudomonas lalkuanensis]|uniref:Cation-transporting P-type ATPase n=1 Tax=Metapseudomonas lalkuanensis TaxID=2604832 RepID=A0A5J6QN50_9GAMM|nr:cation-transporting P-type ATPase [Pseudomonas lalkuanensis]QEY63122.1 cation-transporting P-type ATPase [Pseudomonas lalkuanensis]
MKIQTLRPEDALTSLQSGPDGLTATEAARRLEAFQANSILHMRTVPWWRRLAAGLTHFLAIVLWLAALLAFIAEWSDPGKGMATLGVAILCVILVNALFSYWQEYRAERSILALEGLMPDSVRVMREARLRKLNRSLLVPGDVLLLSAGDNVPADCRILEAFDVRINAATLTGESYPVARDAQPTDAPDLLHCRNILLAGTVLVSGEARALVYATGMRTEFGRIAQLVQTGGDIESPLQRQINRLSRLIALLAMLLGGVFFVLGQWIGLGFWNSLLFGIGIIVANVPEGLLPTVTLSLAMGAQRMAARQALIRNLPSVETLGSATVICTDKTGTLTLNRMQARVVVWAGRETALDSAPVILPQALRAVASLCQTLQLGEVDGRQALVGDPLEEALLRMAQHSGGAVDFPLVDELPFSAERRMLSTLHRSTEGLVLYSKGALEALLPIASRFLQEDGEQPLDEHEQEHWREAEHRLADRGLRVLAFAYRAVEEGYKREDLEQDLVLIGLVGLEDPPRPEVPAAVRRCQQAGIRVLMVTGDHPRTAEAVAREIGLATGRPTVITGTTLASLSHSQLSLALEARELIFARVNPEQKLQIVKELQAKGETVAVTGDGVNDAPALRQGDIGIAMGLSGSDAAREAADMVLLDDNFASIVAAVEEGRAVFQNIRRFMSYILTSNIPEVVPYLAFVLFRIPLPLTVVQILAVDLGTDMLPALGLGAERPDREVMQRPPPSRNDRLLDRRLLARAYLFLGPMEAAAALAAFFFVLRNGGWQYGETLAPDEPLYQVATTACLAAIVVMQMMNVFLCRSERGRPFGFGSPNPLIWAGLVCEVALILFIVYAPLGNWLFGTAPLPVSAWLFMIPFVLAMALLEGIRKARATLDR